MKITVNLIKFTRITQANLDARAAAEEISVGEPFLVVDAGSGGKYAVGTAPDGYILLNPGAVDAEGAVAAIKADPAWKASDWDVAFNLRVTGVSGNGNSTLTITRAGAANLTTDLSHSHDYSDLPMTLTQANNWDTAYDLRVTNFTGSGNSKVTITRAGTTNLTLNLAHTHAEYLTKTAAQTSGTENRTFSSSTESGRIWYMTATAARTYTLSDAPAGFQAIVVLSGSGGQVDFVAGGGQSIVSKSGSSVSLKTLHGAVTLTKRLASQWTIIGDIEET